MHVLDCKKQSMNTCTGLWLHAIVAILSVCAQCRLVQVMHQPKPQGCVCTCIMGKIRRGSKLSTTVVIFAHAPELMLFDIVLRVYTCKGCQRALLEGNV